MKHRELICSIIRNFGANKNDREKLDKKYDKFAYFSKLFIEVGANTLKSSSTFQLPTTIMFGENVRFFGGENKAHIFITKYEQIFFFKL